MNITKGTQFNMTQSRIRASNIKIVGFKDDNKIDSLIQLKGNDNGKEDPVKLY